MTDVNLMGRDVFIGPAGSKDNDKPSGAPVEGCWFCLSSQTADTRLLVSIGQLVSTTVLKLTWKFVDFLLMSASHDIFERMSCIIYCIWSLSR